MSSKSKGVVAWASGIVVTLLLASWAAVAQWGGIQEKVQRNEAELARKASKEDLARVEAALKERATRVEIQGIKEDARVAREKTELANRRILRLMDRFNVDDVVREVE